MLLHVQEGDYNIVMLIAFNYSVKRAMVGSEFCEAGSGLISTPFKVKWRKVVTFFNYDYKIVASIRHKKLYYQRGNTMRTPAEFKQLANEFVTLPLDAQLVSFTPFEIGRGLRRDCEINYYRGNCKIRNLIEFPLR